MLAGKLDRRVTIQRKQVTRDDFGGEVIAWAEVCTVWARIIPLRGSERFVAQQEQADRDARVQMRWWPGITPAMRVIYEGRVWDIEAVAELGRRDGLELLVVTAELGVGA